MGAVCFGVGIYNLKIISTAQPQPRSPSWSSKLPGPQQPPFLVTVLETVYDVVILRKEVSKCFQGHSSMRNQMPSFMRDNSSFNGIKGVFHLITLLKILNFSRSPNQKTSNIQLSVANTILCRKKPGLLGEIASHRTGEEVLQS